MHRWLHRAPALINSQLMGLFSPGGGVSFPPGPLQAPCDSLRSGNDAITDGDAPKVSDWFPLRLLGPSAEEGVRHVKMTRRETSSAALPDINRRFCSCLQNLPTSLRRRYPHTGFPQSTERGKKGQSKAVGFNKKNVLEYPSYPRMSWRPGSSCRGGGK